MLHFLHCGYTWTALLIANQNRVIFYVYYYRQKRCILNLGQFGDWLKSACERTHSQNNSINSLTPEFKWASFEKRKKLDELVNIPTKAEERSMIQISFRTQDPNITAGTIRNPRQNLRLIHNPLCFQIPRIRSIPQSVRFLRQNPSIQRSIHTPPLDSRTPDPCCLKGA